MVDAPHRPCGRSRDGRAGLGPDPRRHLVHDGLDSRAVRDLLHDEGSQETLLRVLAKEVAATGVTVNTVAVRAIDAEHVREHEPSPKNASWTTPEEVVATFRFLCSDDAAAINGARIPLDGRA